MQTLPNSQKNRSDGSQWYLLAEFSLCEFLSNHERSENITIGYLSRAVCRLGMLPECVENILVALAELAKVVIEQHAQGNLNSLGRIRVFCQKRVIDEARSTEKSQLCRTEQYVKHAQMYMNSRTNLDGGWGYFLIERGEDVSAYPLPIPHYWIDLYIYKEGNL